MIEIGVVGEYDAEVAEAMGELLCALSSSYNGEAVARERIEEIIESPWHDIMVAFDGEELVGMASLSVIMGTKIGRNLYLEDLVVKAGKQGQGIGSLLWEKILEWGRKKGCKRLEFTSSGKGKKQGAVDFYLAKGAEIRETNCFRVELGSGLQIGEGGGFELGEGK
ncbi:GNAT family N-acetyltransferase [Candidatus Saccharibacteria bacterium]|nr:GNAT family N-acetyltransferase [Candidatus Saccharibacteria bacterium]